MGSVAGGIYQIMNDNIGEFGRVPYGFCEDPIPAEIANKLAVLKEI
jgi:hypothetical protein